MAVGIAHLPKMTGIGLPSSGFSIVSGARVSAPSTSSGQIHIWTRPDAVTVTVPVPGR